MYNTHIFPSQNHWTKTIEGVNVIHQCTLCMNKYGNVTLNSLSTKNKGRPT